MPNLILITGAPGSGKSRLMKELKSRFNIPALSKDAIKESLFDALPEFNQELSKTLGIASYASFYAFAEQMLKNEQDCILESNFKTPFSEEDIDKIITNYPANIVQVRCVASLDALKDRIINRWESGERHAGHQDHVWIESGMATSEEELQVHRLKYNDKYIEVNTEDFDLINYDDIAKQIQSLLVRP